eukprot:COSAG01_NODE_2134_length_8347_cov_43.066319_6_plen_328_part_00
MAAADDALESSGGGEVSALLVERTGPDVAEATVVSRTTRLSVGFSALGGILFGMDLANWAGASNQPDFLEVFCVRTGYGAAAACLAGTAQSLPMEFAIAVGNMSAMLQVGAAISALVVAPRLARRKGRRAAISVGAVISILGMLGMCVVSSVGTMILTRLVLGAGIGCITYSLSMYLGEITPTAARGRLASTMQLFTVIGVVLAAFLNTFLGEDGWPYWFSFASPIFPATVLAIGIHFVPESPRWVLYEANSSQLRGYDGTVDAATVLGQLRDLSPSSPAVQRELVAMKEGLEAEVNHRPAPWLWLQDTPCKCMSFPPVTGACVWRV